VPTYCGVRSPRWKYVAYQTREEELYDLRRDPLELVNLAGDPAHRAQLAHGRASVLRLCRPTPPGLELGWLVEP
jgi:choline-sulfatase